MAATAPLRVLLLASLAGSALACSSGDTAGSSHALVPDAGQGNGGAGTGGMSSAAGGGSAGTGGGVAGGSGGSTGGGDGAGGVGMAGSGGSAGNGTGGAAGAGSTCQPILNQAGLDTGFDSCADGSKHRRAVRQCPTEKQSATSPCQPGFGPPDCTSDAQCTQQPLGYCADAHRLTGYCGCYYGCQKDSDCGAGSLCDCGVVVGQCVPAACTTNADCGAGFGCVATRDGTAGTTCTSTYPPPALRYACQTAADQCKGNQDCPGGGAAQGTCLFDGGHRACGLICLPTP